jgi:HK97 family phage prohead protease
MEYAGSPFQIKALSDSGQIEGLLAGFGNVDYGGDRLHAGCLSKSLAARSTPLPMLLHHDLQRPIGAWKEWNESSDGLYVKGNITLATRDGAEAHALASDGALTGLSVGWLPVKGDRDSKGVRDITEAELFEGSLVPVPMNPMTRVTSVKSITRARDIRELLQAAGVPRDRANEAAGAAWKAINETDDDAEAEAEVRALLNASAKRIAALGGNPTTYDPRASLRYIMESQR